MEKKNTVYILIYLYILCNNISGNLNDVFLVLAMKKVNIHMLLCGRKSFVL